MFAASGDRPEAERPLQGDASICSKSRANSKERITTIEVVDDTHVDEVDSEDMRLVEEAVEDEVVVQSAEAEVERIMLHVPSARSHDGKRDGKQHGSASQTSGGRWASRSPQACRTPQTSRSPCSRNPSKTILKASHGQGGEPPFSAVMASNFEMTQKALIESQEQALALLSRCMEEIRHKDKVNRDLRHQLANLGGMHNEVERQKSGCLYDMTATKSARSQMELDDSSADSFSASFKPPIAEEGHLPSTPMGIAPSLSLNYDKDPDGGHSQKPSKQASGRGSPGPDAEEIEGPSASRDNSLTIGQSRGPNRRPSSVSNTSLHSSQHKFELLTMWKQNKKKSRKRNKMGKLVRSCSFESLGSCESMDFGGGDPTECCACCGDRKVPVLDPNSAKRAVWDISATLLICYDIVAIPLLLFDLPDGPFIQVMDWSTRLFWSVDIFMSFMTGYMLQNGTVEMRSRKIAKNYLLSWFCIDLFIVVSDWIEVLWAKGGLLGFARAGKASRTFRIIRMVRLIRLARVKKLYSAFLERLKNEQLVIIAGMFNIMLVIMALSHVIACLWYGVANQDRPDTWLKVHQFDQATFDYKYTTALHWSLLQFAGGTDEIVPQNTDERVCAIGVFLLAFVMAAVFVGRLTSSMTQLHMLSRKDVERFQILRKYLAKNEISAYLSMRVIHNAQHALQETQRFMEESRVELLTLISDPLRVELHFELYSPVLAVHPFFHCFIEAAPQVMKKVCHKAMSQLLVSDGDILFMPGEVPSPPRMIIVCSGQLSYTYISGAVAYVQAGQWISEAALWIQWTHQGMLKASKDCRLCILDGGKFCQLTDTFDHDFDIRIYARMFAACINDGSIDPSDLPWDDTCSELMEAIGESAPHLALVNGPNESMEDGGRRTSGGQWSVGSSIPSDDANCSPKFKKSVLMVTPNGNDDKLGWW